MSENHTYALILAGGGGTRLWPKSREKHPKQLLNLGGDASMIQLTASRFAKVVGWEHVFVISSHQYQKEIVEQLPDIPANNFLFEPAKKDTALAMLVGALYIANLDPEAVIVNDASDHIVDNEAEFVRLMKAAATVAADKTHLVAVGIKPTSPSTAFGYIKIGTELKKVDRSVPVFKVESFTEKPNAATAQAFVSTGRYFWNANNYVWSVQAILAAFKQHMPTMFELTKSLHNTQPDQFRKNMEPIYEKAEVISIDYAISEKSDNLVLIPGDFGWNDIGEWKVVYDLGKKDLAGNVVIADGKTERMRTLTVESQNNLIHVGDRLVALLGVHDMIVVDTPEVIMIAPKHRSQDVKKLVERLKSEHQEEYL